LRQASSLSKESEAVRNIRVIAAQYRKRFLSDLPESGRNAIDVQMAKLLTVNVLEAFHVSKPKLMRPLYRWKRGWSHVELSAESLRFLKGHNAERELIANFHWPPFWKAAIGLLRGSFRRFGATPRRASRAEPSLKYYLEKRQRSVSIVDHRLSVEGRRPSTTSFHGAFCWRMSSGIWSWRA
jgi:hypothetical protein